MGLSTTFPLLPPPPPLPPPQPPLRPAPAIPIGYRFVPKDHELLNYYLKSKITGTFDELLRYPKIIEANVYGDHPSKIFSLAGVEGEEDDDDEDTQHYFFTRLKKTTEKSRRVSRRIADFGTWKAENCKEILMPKSKFVIGYNKYFKYVPDKHGDEKDERVEWLMHEYSLLENQEIVICRITKKVNKKVMASIKNGAKKRALEPNKMCRESSTDDMMRAITTVPVQEPEAKRARLEQPSMSEMMICQVDDQEVRQSSWSVMDIVFDDDCCCDKQEETCGNVSKGAVSPSEYNFEDLIDPCCDLLDTTTVADQEIWVENLDNWLSSD